MKLIMSATVQYVLQYLGHGNQIIFIIQVVSALLTTFTTLINSESHGVAVRTPDATTVSDTLESSPSETVVIGAVALSRSVRLYNSQSAV